MTRRQTNNQWSGGIADHPAPNISECKNPLENFSRGFFFYQDGILLIDYLPDGQTTNAQYYISLLVQLKGILKEKRRGKFTKWVLHVLLHDNIPAYQALATQNKLAYLGFHCLDHPPYSPDLAPSDYHMFLGLKKKTIESSPFFFRRGGHCCHGHLVGRTNFWIFEWLANVRATG